LLLQEEREACHEAVAVALLLAVATPVAAQQDDWPGFRGRTGSGIVAGSLDIDGLSPTVVWRVQTGIGYSGVTVADGKAITMFEDDAQVMIAYDAASGEELWRQRIADAYPGRDGSWNGPIATPVAYGDLVIGFEPWGRLFALATADGSPVWSVHLADDLGAPRPIYGFASSPIVVGDTLVVHGGTEAGTVLGFDVATGELRWQVGTEGAEA
jgi:outer membrane protein assembly factor BamB